MSKKEKKVFDEIGSFEFVLDYQSLSLAKKIRVTDTAEKTETFFAADGKKIDGENLEIFRDYIARTHSSILFDLFESHDLFWGVFSEMTRKPYVFREKEKDGEDAVGTYLFIDENLAIEKISKLSAAKNCYIEVIDDAYDFIKHGVEIDGYDFVEIFADTASVKILDCDILWDNNSGLTVEINEYAQKRHEVPSAAEELLPGIIDELIHADYFVPVMITEKGVIIAAIQEQSGALYFPMYTSFEEYVKPSTPRYGCLDLCLFDILPICDAKNLIPIINPFSAGFVITKDVRKLIEKYIEDESIS